MSEDKLFKLMADSEGAADMTMAINKIADKTRGARLFNMVREYWINPSVSLQRKLLTCLVRNLLTFCAQSKKQ